MIHKRVIGKAHPSFDSLLPFSSDRFNLTGMHSQQLYNHCCEVATQWRLYERSIFGMVDVYNFHRLPSTAAVLRLSKLFSQREHEFDVDRAMASGCLHMIFVEGNGWHS